MTARLALLAAVAALSIAAGPALADEARADWRDGFRPVAGAIQKYTDAMAQGYTPRVKGRGVAAVQAEVWATGYRADSGADAWRPGAVWTGGGDCEDLAMAKVLELRAQGINDTYLLVMANVDTGEGHAIAAVRDQGQWWALGVSRSGLVPLSAMLENYAIYYFIETRTGRVFA